MADSIAPWFEGGLLGFDTETTGIDPETDRIVEASVILSQPDGSFLERHFLINPGVPIPEEASAVHGITNEKVAAEGMSPFEALTQIRAKLSFGRLPVVAYNAVYDLTIFDRECRRHGVQPYAPAHVVDPLVIDKHVNRYVRGAGQRKLEPTAARYGVELVNAHSASADTIAALQLARAMGRLGKVTADIAELTAAQQRWRFEQDMDFQAWRRSKQEPGEEPFTLDPRWPLVPFGEPYQPQLTTV